MPSRVIRGEINSSESLSLVSPEAELAFRALLLAVDDYGRADARPEMLKAALFPMRRAFTEDRIFDLVRELAAIPDPPVVLYEVEGRPYLQLTGWDRHRGRQKRAETSRFPAPPEYPQGFSGDPEISPEIPGDPRRSGERSEGIPGDPGDSRRSERLASGEHRASCGEHREEVPPAAPAQSPPKDVRSAPRKPPPEIPRFATDASALLGELLHGVPGAQFPRGWERAWAAEVARLVRDTPDLAALADPWPLLEAAIRWLFSEHNAGKYALVVRSGRALREKWPRIVAAAQRERADSWDDFEAQMHAVAEGRH